MTGRTVSMVTGSRQLLDLADQVRAEQAMWAHPSTVMIPWQKRVNAYRALAAGADLIEDAARNALTNSDVFAEEWLTQAHGFLHGYRTARLKHTTATTQAGEGS